MQSRVESLMMWMQCNCVCNEVSMYAERCRCMQCGVTVCAARCDCVCSAMCLSVQCESIYAVRCAVRCDFVCSEICLDVQCDVTIYGVRNIYNMYRYGM